MPVLLPPVLKTRRCHSVCTSSSLQSSSSSLLSVFHETNPMGVVVVSASSSSSSSSSSSMQRRYSDSAAAKGGGSRGQEDVVILTLRGAQFDVSNLCLPPSPRLEDEEGQEEDEEGQEEPNERAGEEQRYPEDAVQRQQEEQEHEEEAETNRRESLLYPSIDGSKGKTARSNNRDDACHYADFDIGPHAELIFSKPPGSVSALSSPSSSPVYAKRTFCKKDNGDHYNNSNDDTDESLWTLLVDVCDNDNDKSLSSLTAPFSFPPNTTNTNKMDDSATLSTADCSNSYLYSSSSSSSSVSSLDDETIVTVTTSSTAATKPHHHHHNHHQQEQDDACDNALSSSTTKTSTEIEISPGFYQPLRGARETLRSIQNKTVVVVPCLACCASLYCVRDAHYVICPACRVVSPKHKVRAMCASITWLHLNAYKLLASFEGGSRNFCHV